MKLDLTEILIILTYSSILIEIVLFPVPSVASSFQLIVRKKSLPENFLYTKVQNFNAWKKIVFLAIPTLLSLVAFCFPLILIMLSKFSNLMINKTEKLELIIIAFLLIFAGRIISLYSVMSIRKNNRQTGDSFELKTRKIFSFSRNPILLGTYLTYIGMIVLLPHWFLLITFAVFFIHMHFRILIEESFLKFKFGDKYASYLERTKRYF